MRKLYSACPVDSRLEGRTTTRNDRRTEKAKVGQDGSRYIRAIDHFVGEERGGAAEPGKEHLAPRTPVTRSCAGEIWTGEAIRGRVVGEMLCLRIEA